MLVTSEMLLLLLLLLLLLPFPWMALAQERSEVWKRIFVSRELLLMMMLMAGRVAAGTLHWGF